MIPSISLYVTGPPETSTSTLHLGMLCLSIRLATTLSQMTVRDAGLPTDVTFMDISHTGTLHLMQYGVLLTTAFSFHTNITV